MSLVASTLIAKDFTYQTFGGIWNVESPHAASTHYAEDGGQATSGPWAREGDFSGTYAGGIIPWGDQDSTFNKMDPRSPHNDGTILGASMYPAMAWGKDAVDPWVTTEVPGGGSGIGVTGYGYPKSGTGMTITVGNSGKFYPFGSFTHHNAVINFYGSVDMTIGWNLKLYDPDALDPTAPIEEFHYHFTIKHWETYNLSDSCPRHENADGSVAALGSSVEDTAFNTAATDIEDIGLENTFVRDNNTIDETNYGCSDPFTFGYEAGDGRPLTVTSAGLRDEFSHGDRNYEILFTGFYDNDESQSGCVETDFGKSANWDNPTCFKAVHTLWSAEEAHSVGYVRIAINEIGGGDQGCTPGYWKQPHHFDSWTNPPYAPGDSFNTTFGCGPDITLADALDPKKAKKANKDGGVLMMHSVAALLNTASENVNYPDAGDIINDTCTALDGTKNDMNTLKNTYEGYNEGPPEYDGEWCPLN